MKRPVRARLSPALLMPVLLTVSAMLLAGCWDRVEVNDLAIVQMTAFDKEEDRYRVSVSFPLVGQMGGPEGGGGGTGGEGNQSNYAESAEAPAIRTAFLNLQHKLSRHLYYAHRRVALVGEEMAKQGVTDILDIIARFPENRISTHVLVAQGSGRALMETPVVMERIPAEMFREIVVGVMNKPVTAKHFIHAILAEGSDPYTLAFKKSKTKTDGGQMAADTIEIAGLAVFRKDRLAGILEGKHVNGALAALNQLRRPVFSARIPQADDYISAQFTELTARLEPEVNGDDIRMRIVFEGIYEINVNQTELPLAQFERAKRVTEAIEREIHDQVSKAVNEVQTRFKSDIFGFGNAIRIHHPKLWKRISDRWRDVYPDIPVEYRFNIRMEHVGSLNRPINEKEKEFKQ